MPFWRKKINPNMKCRMKLWNFNNHLTRQWYIDISTWIWMQYLQNNTPATVSGYYLICITWRKENEVHRVSYRIIIPTFIIICLEHRQVSPWWLTEGRGRDRILTADKGITLLKYWYPLHMNYNNYIWDQFLSCLGTFGLAYWPKTHVCAASSNCMLCDYNSILQCNNYKTFIIHCLKKKMILHCIVHQKKNLHKQWSLWYIIHCLKKKSRIR